jgi:hypothetical protein
MKTDARGVVRWVSMFAAITLAGLAGAEEIREAQPLRLELTLTDGSRVIGTPEIETVPVETPYARMDLPLAQIASITMGEDRETATIDLQNGDKMKGVITLKPIRLETVFGKVAVDVMHIRKLCVLPPGRALSEALRRGLVLHYTFDQDEGGKITDLSGKGNDGVMHSAKLEGEGSGRHLRLEGENNHVRVPNSASLEVGSALTVSARVKLTSFGPAGYGNEFGFIVNKGHALWWNPAFFLGYSKGTGSGDPRWPAKPGPYPAVFHVCNTTGAQTDGGKRVNSETLLHTDRWYHLAGTYDGKHVSLYIDGKLEGRAEYSGPLRADRAPVLLGGASLGGVEWGNHFTSDVILDEVMIFDRALTEGEIFQLHRAGM